MIYSSVSGINVSRSTSPLQIIKPNRLTETMAVLQSTLVEQDETFIKHSTTGDPTQVKRLEAQCTTTEL